MALCHSVLFFGKVVVIMAAAWVTNFFISVHPLLEAVFYQTQDISVCVGDEARKYFFRMRPR